MVELITANKKLTEAGKPPFSAGGNVLDLAVDVLKTAGLLERSGGVLLSNEAAVRYAPIYFLGLNPGGSEDEGIVYPTLLDNLVSARIGTSAWDDPEPWGSITRLYQPGRAPMQVRFKAIAAFLGLNYLDIPASNLVFTRSRDVTSHADFDADREACRPVHELFLNKIQPQKLWLMGNPENAGDMLTDVVMDWCKARHANWSIGHGSGTFCGQKMEICHTPHLSIWDPTGKEDLLTFAFGKKG